jgi:hypothetical protein
MLETRRYRPVYPRGRPITTSYVFNVRVKPPEDTRGSQRRSSLPRR